MTRLKLFQCKNIPDELVLKLAIKAHSIYGFHLSVADLLLKCYEPLYGQNAAVNVVYAKLQRLESRGFLEYGVSLGTAWITEEGRQHLSSLEDLETSSVKDELDDKTQ